MCYTIGYITAFIPKFLIFLDVVCSLKTLGICAVGFLVRVDFSVRLDRRKNIKPLKSARSICT